MAIVLEKLSARTLMLAFEQIKQHGRRKGDAFVYQALGGELGHDGYTLSIENDSVRATVQFHNAIDVKYSSRIALKQFCEQVRLLSGKRL